MWKSDEGKNISYWQASEDGLQNDSLAESIDTDVCIIGGGISGLTTAYLLTKAGKKVIVIDDGTIGGGETARTTAHLSNAIDDRYDRVELLRARLVQADPDERIGLATGRESLVERHLAGTPLAVLVHRAVDDHANIVP